ncbi:MAG: NAD(P)/FAD-dependent oxidoreductase [Acidimicrobiales bacterium]
MTVADEVHDVVVVGARCAGAPLATFLARAGLSVALVDRATFPSDTASTHVFQASGVAVLGRLGVVDRLLDTGAPWLETADFLVGEVAARLPWPTLAGDPGPGLCVRRHVLDAILVDNAEAAGAVVHQRTRVTGLLRDGGRVTGVVARSDGPERRLLAPLVIGADGRRSSVARLVGARAYNVSPNERFGFWGYFEGANWAPPASIHFLRWDDELVIACPADAGLYLVAVLPPLAELNAFTADVQASYDERVRRCLPLAATLAGARRVGRPRGMASFNGFFRESAGPGWALVGDAGHFKDPSPGQGISDALRQAERMAGAITGVNGNQADTDAALADWWRWRDRDSAEMHWFAHDLGAAGPVPIVFTEIIRGLATEPDGLRRAVDVFNHRVRPSELLTPARLAAAAGRAVISRRHPARPVLREVRTVVSEDLRRRWRNRFPAYATAHPVPDADPAEPPA